jgi:hypothetical protein
MIENSTSNYFERGKHALDSYDPLYVLNYHIMLVPSDGAVMVCIINEVNDRPVGNPKSKV